MLMACHVQAICCLCWMLLSFDIIYQVLTGLRRQESVGKKESNSRASLPHCHVLLICGP